MYRELTGPGGRESLEPQESPNAVILDRLYENIIPSSWVMLEEVDKGGTRSDAVYIGRVTEAQTISIFRYGISGQATRIRFEEGSVFKVPRSTLKPEPEANWLEKRVTLGDVRGITVHAQGDRQSSEQLALAEEPITADIFGGEIELDGLYDGFEPGRWIIVSGKRRLPGESTLDANELVMIAGVTVGKDDSRPGDHYHTTLLLYGNGLKYVYQRETVKIYANVAQATHGETVNEVLGSGDSAKAQQQFTLRRSPLTYVPAATAKGIDNTLQVYVNDLEWQETEFMAGAAPTDRVFVTEIDHNQQPSAIFGDGEHGTRLPTGRENIRARYRVGLGKAGNADARSINQLVTKPLGLKGVVNPLPASGGADPDTTEQIRRRAPLALTSLDRLISVQDYEDFALSFAGIDKAKATLFASGQHQVVYVTVAGIDEAPLDPNSSLIQLLCEAFQRYGDPQQAVIVEVCEPLLIMLEAAVHLTPGYLWEKVEPAVRGALLERYKFEHRQLGQDVVAGDVLSTIQGVRGVDYVDLDNLALLTEADTQRLIQGDTSVFVRNDPATGKRRLPIHEARYERLTARLLPGTSLKQFAADRGFDLNSLTALNPEIPQTTVAVNPGDPVEDAVFDEEITLITSQRIRPSQLAYLTPTLPLTLILQERTS